jgi:hypothetical protein
MAHRPIGAAATAFAGNSWIPRADVERRLSLADG